MHETSCAFVGLSEISQENCIVYLQHYCCRDTLDRRHIDRDCRNENRPDGLFGEGGRPGWKEYARGGKYMVPCSIR